MQVYHHNLEIFQSHKLLFIVLDKFLISMQRETKQNGTLTREMRYQFSLAILLSLNRKNLYSQRFKMLGCSVSNEILNISLQLWKHFVLQSSLTIILLAGCPLINLIGSVKFIYYILPMVMTKTKQINKYDS